MTNVSATVSPNGFLCWMMTTTEQFFLLSFVLFPYVYVFFLYSLKKQQVMFCLKFVFVSLFWLFHLHFLKGFIYHPFEERQFLPQTVSSVELPTLNWGGWENQQSLQTSQIIFSQNQPGYLSSKPSQTFFCHTYFL